MGKHTWALGFFFWFFVLLVHSLVDSSGKPQTLCLSYLSVSWGVGLSPYGKAFFICSSVHAQGYLGHLELVFFSCLWVSWVACHPASIWPGKWKARTAAIWSREAHAGYIATLVSPPNAFSIPRESHIYMKLMQIIYNNTAWIQAKYNNM